MTSGGLKLIAATAMLLALAAWNDPHSRKAMGDYFRQCSEAFHEVALPAFEEINHGFVWSFGKAAAPFKSISHGSRA